MVGYCAAFACKEKFVKGGKVTFHAFPKDETKRKLWEIKLRRKDFKATDHSRICSRHFTAESFDTNRFGGTWLRKDAIPTIFDFPNNYSGTNESLKLPIKIKLQTEGIVNSHDDLSPEIDRKVNSHKKFRYLADFTESDMNSPTKAQRFFNIAMNFKEKKNMQLRTLRRQNRSLQKRVASLEQKLKDIKENSLVTDAENDALELTLLPGPAAE